MMINNVDFLQIAQWQQSALKNRALVRVLHEAANEVLEVAVTPLARAYHEASIAAVFQQFGFVVFAPESRRLLSLSQSQQTRVPSGLILDWLDQAAYQQLADFHVLRYLESEPDWLILNQEFCVTVLQRMVSCRPDEWMAVGLCHYPQELLDFLLKAVDGQMEALRKGLPLLSGFEALSQVRTETQEHTGCLMNSLALWGKAIDHVMARMIDDPLCLLVWRLEAFSTERQLQTDASLAVRVAESPELENRALAIIALMVVLADIKISSKGPIIPSTPVTVSQLTKSLSSFLRMQCHESRIISELLGLSGNGQSLSSATLENILMLGLQLGVFQWTAIAKRQRAVLLTSLAFAILDPYRDLIEATFKGDQPPQ
jgi:hypothetical protein